MSDVDILQCYKVLDLEPGASAESVRRSYVELSQVWDPDRYVANAVLRDRAEKKRKEIETAYNAIKAFLPELQDPQDQALKERRPERDFTELSVEPPIERSRAMMGIIVGIVLLCMFVWAIFLIVKGSHAASVVPLVE